MEFHEVLESKPDSWNNDRLHFFKYMSFETAKIVLANRTLRWSTPKTMNDVYDVQFDLGMNIDPSKLECLAHEKMWQIVSGQETPENNSMMNVLLRLVGIVPEIDSKEEFVRQFEGVVRKCLEKMEANLSDTQDEFRKNMEDLKILCLTEDPTNPPMWAHYAELNTGVVIRFRSIPALDTPYGMAKPIEYLQALPTFMDEEHIANVLAGIAPDNARASMDHMIYSKGEAWAYEKEWRISSGDGRDKSATHEDILFGSNELDGVILGINMNAENRKEIINLTSPYPNVELMEAVRSSSGFHHEIVLLED